MIIAIFPENTTDKSPDKNPVWDITETGKWEYIER
jgi:hypothetical protein